MIKFNRKGKLLEGSKKQIILMGKWVKKPIPVDVFQITTDFVVETLEGEMKGKPLDYLIRGIEGEYYPCDKKIFEKSYKIFEG
jgi:hypothetical protein